MVETHPVVTGATELVQVPEAIEEGDYVSAAESVASVAPIPGAKGVGVLKTLLRGGRRANPCSFVAGTLVATENGLVPIEQIRIGERVWARNVTTGETALKPVTALPGGEKRAIWRVAIADANGAIETFSTTNNHPWWIFAQGNIGRWVTTDELASDMLVVARKSDGPYGGAVVRDVRETDHTDVNYNLTVSDFKTYFVGKHQLLVHNCQDTVGRTGTPNNAIGNNRHSVIGGREYTGHALDRMQETGMTPTVVENTISAGTRTAGNRIGTTKHFTDEVMVVTDDATGRVITTDPLRGQR